MTAAQTSSEKDNWINEWNEPNQGTPPPEVPKEPEKKPTPETPEPDVAVKWRGYWTSA